MTPSVRMNENMTGEQGSPQSVEDKMRAELSSIPGVSSEEVESAMSNFGAKPAEQSKEAPAAITAKEIENVNALEAEPEKEVVLPDNVPLAGVVEKTEANSNEIADLLNIEQKKESVLENFEQVSKEVSSILGSEVKDFGDVIKIAQQASDLKKQVETQSKDVERAQQYEELFTSLPNEVFEIVQAVVEGTYDKTKLAELSGVIIDYKKPFEEQSKEKLISKYAPHLLEDEFYMEDDDRVEKDLKTIKVIFEKDKAEFNKTVDERKQRVKDSEAAYLASTKVAVESLDSIDYFKFKDVQKLRVSKIMEKGVQGIMELYFNEDGSYKKEAAELVALNLFGKDSIKFQRELLSKKIEKKVETKINEQLLSRGNDNPPSSNAGAVITGKSDEEMLEEINQLIPSPKKGIFS
jgi:hypothetical protein